MEDEKQQSLLGLGAGVYKDYATLSLTFGGYRKGDWGGFPGANLFKKKILKYNKLHKGSRFSRVFLGGYETEAKAGGIFKEALAGIQKESRAAKKAVSAFKTKDWLGVKSKWAKKLASGDFTKFRTSQQKILRKAYKSYTRYAIPHGKEILVQDEWIRQRAYKSKPVQEMIARSIKRSEALKAANATKATKATKAATASAKEQAYQFTRKGMKGVKGIKGLEIAGKVLGWAGVAFTAATVISDVTKIASAVGSMTVDLPLFIEQKTAPIKKLLASHPEFGGSQTAARYGATERSRALQAITTSGGIINDRRFIGQEARYYSQF